jgi:uncharacterized protein DUF4062
MSKTHVFVSSTCYDLSAVRESIRQSLLCAGHEPVLSEYPSFPVLPNLSTVENCKKVVRENTDVFVLVVGGERGSLDPETSKSVVNVEFNTAVEMGLPVVVFVKKEVASYLDVWKKNRTADFRPHVNSPQVFEFLNTVYQRGRWVFTFEKSGEISEILLGQLSVMLRDLLPKARTGIFQIVHRFADESANARQIVIERPKHWEYLLTIELLRSKLAPINKRFDDLKNGHAFRRAIRLQEKETFDWLMCKMEDLRNLGPYLQGAISTDLVASWGLPGEPGNPLAILAAVEKVCEGGSHLLAWEEEIRFTSLPPQIQDIQETLRGTTAQFVEQLNDLADKLEAPFKKENPFGKYEITLLFKDPPNMPKLNRQLSLLQKDIERNPWNWVGWS